MRNPDRIPKMVALFAEAWSLVPDWRMGQLMSNLIGAGRQDVFHPTDGEWEVMLEKFIAEHKQ